MASAYARLRRELSPNQGTVDGAAASMHTKVTFVPATSVGLRETFEQDDRADELSVGDDARPVIRTGRGVDWTLASRAYPDVLGELLCMMYGLPTSTAGGAGVTDPDGNAIPAGATRHVWTSSTFGPSGSLAQTAEIIGAYNTDLYKRVRGAACTSLEINAADTRLQASGSGLFVGSISNPSLTPVVEAGSVLPLGRPGVAFPAWYAGTARTRALTLRLGRSIQVPTDLAWSTTLENNLWPGAVYKGDGPATLEGTVEKVLMSTADYDRLSDAAGFAGRIRLESRAFITGSYRYRLWLASNNFQLIDGESEAIENKLLIGASYTFRASRDTGDAITITLVNATASYT
jgi:hypothetical protein